MTDEDGTELLEFDVPEAHYKAVKFGRVTPHLLMDEWFPVELIEEPKG